MASGSREDEARLLATRGRLRARPGASSAQSPPANGPLAAGVHHLDAGGGDARGGLLLVPSHVEHPGDAPLVVMLHGAGADAANILPVLADEAERQGIVVLAPDSRGPTWDALLGGLGPDVAFLDAALAQLFARVRVDPRRIAIAGFSDGASYALALGIGNGALFESVLAFSPGFIPRIEAEGSPRVFVTHGVRDSVLPIAHCSRRIVPALERVGHVVEYREFADGHVVPPALVRDAVAWWLDGASRRAP